jgi:hypothetical protein
MADSDFVQAQVADIRGPGCPLPPQVVVDANALYFTFYPGFHHLTRAGGGAPRTYQTRHYPAWVNRCLRAGTFLYASPTTIGEFIRLCEYAELELRWLQTQPHPPPSPFSGQDCKAMRYSGTPATLQAHRQVVQTALRSLLAIIRLLPCWPAPQQEQADSFAEWLASAGDAADAAMVANAKMAGIPHILSDDRDLMTFAGVTLYTANIRAINADFRGPSNLPE